MPQLAAEPWISILAIAKHLSVYEESVWRWIKGSVGVRSLLQRLVSEGKAKVERQKRGTRYVATGIGAFP